MTNRTIPLAKQDISNHKIEENSSHKLVAGFHSFGHTVILGEKKEHGL